MRVIEITAHGAPEVLVEAVRADPVAGAGEALIRVAASMSVSPAGTGRHCPIGATQSSA